MKNEIFEYEQKILNQIDKFDLNNIEDLKTFLYIIYELLQKILQYIIYENNNLDSPDEVINQKIQSKILTLINQQSSNKNVYYNKEKLETKLTDILPKRIFDQQVFNNGEFR